LSAFALHSPSVPVFLVPFFFFNAPPTTQISTLSLHDALPISTARGVHTTAVRLRDPDNLAPLPIPAPLGPVTGAPPGKVSEAERSEEHTSELQSQSNLVCRLLLEKKKKKKNKT